MNKTRIKNQLKIDEGLVQQIYKDSLGYKTFGYGHLVTRDDPEWNLPVGHTVKSERIKAVFEEDFATAVKSCETLYDPDFYEWPCEVQEILVNMMFNLGLPKLSKFVKFKAALKERNWAEAAKEGRDSKWYGQVKGRGKRLMSLLEAV